jgi:LmbE family N-acetylglucosaminyl deacetylase
MMTEIFNLLGKKILFVTAHPDDESFLMAGTIRRNLDLGGDSFLVCATLGEKGTSHLRKSVTSLEMKMIRKKELQSAAKFLKVKKLFILDLPDCGLSMEKNSEKLGTELQKIVRSVKPDFIVSFAKDGITGHKDHVVAGKIAYAVAKENKIVFVACCASPSMAKAKSRLIGRRRRGSYVASLRHVKPNFRIKVDQNVKLKAIHFHKSQIGTGGFLLGMPKSTARNLVKWEYFRG